ncbi:MAG: glycosyltransferase family 39 protein, partial [Chloroflexota bacterium]|nr:glycosyltransferase family 39 protein [Chloroflexota bacterium]
MILGGLVGFTLLLGRTFYPRRTPSARRLTAPGQIPAHRWLRWGATLLSLSVGLASRSRPADSDFTALFLLWLLALATFAGSLCMPLRGKWQKPALSRREYLALLGLLVAALGVRALALGHIPANVGGDEGTQALAGLRLVERPLGNPFATGWYSVPTLSFMAYGLTMRVFGTGIAGMRALSSLIGALTVLTTWLLGRELGGRKAGWLAATVVAFSAYHIHFSRLASNQIADPLIGTLTCWLLWRALHRRDSSEAPTPVEWGLGGMVMGLGWYLYFGARWVTALVTLWLLWRALAEPRFVARRRRGLWTLAGGWLVVTLPLLAWYTLHPSDLTARYNAVSIFASGGWLDQALAATGKTAGALLLQQLWKTVTAFHLTPDPTFWYHPGIPLLDFILGAFLLVGLIAAALRWRWPSRGFTLLWFCSTLLMAWGLTENPPSSQRGLSLVPAVALLIAWGVTALWEAAPRHRRTVQQITLALLAAACILNLSFYFVIYTPRRTYGNPTAEIATDFARFAL